MRLIYLRIISEFKNLQGIEIKLNAEENRTVIIGQNGTGKSNIIEALVHIFKQLDSAEPPVLSYDIKYKIGDGEVETLVHIVSDKDRKPHYEIKYQEHNSGVAKTAWLDLEIAKVKRDSDGLSRFLPRNVFAYYSGPSDRLESLFYDTRRDFYLEVIKEGSEIRDNIRPFFYAKPFHSQFSLLAFFIARGFPEAARFLKKELSIEKFESATFVLTQPTGWGTKIRLTFGEQKALSATF